MFTLGTHFEELLKNIQLNSSKSPIVCKSSAEGLTVKARAAPP